MPPVGRKPGEFAPGIPKARKVVALPRVARTKPQQWQMATQRHLAERSGEHTDLRLVDPKGRAHSWAIPQAKLPGPGEKVLALRQPTHAREYSAKKGTFELPEGYGKGKVRGSGLRPAEVVSSRPGVLRFNLYKGRAPQEFAIVKTPKGDLLHNFTATRESGVRGVGGHEIPQSKPRYREKRPESIRFDDPNEIHQAKLDGSGVTLHLPAKGKQIRAFSHRPTERATGVIEHTHKLPNFRKLRTPKGLAGTVVRGELWAANQDGKALPAERVGAMLNANVPKSRQMQQEYGALRGAIFDVVRYKGRRVEEAPYAKKLEMLKNVAKRIPALKLPPMAQTASQKKKLWAKIQAGELPETSEGVVSWRKDEARPTKIKLRPDMDVEVVGVTEGKGKHKGRLGALKVKLPGQSAVTNVGTGMSDAQRRELWEKRNDLIGRVAKVETQQVFPSGRLRAPSFKEWHLEKGKQAAMESKQQFGFLDELNRINLRRLGR